jgi:2-hydroxychromene-2-carboxylate isomerase
VAHIDFFHFFGRGHAYLSVLRIDRLAADAGVEVRWRPIDVRTLMAKNNVALRSGALKVRYLWRDIERRAAHHGLPFVKPPIWTTDPNLLANRVGIVAAQGGWCREYTVASFRAWYLDGMPLGTKESLAHILGPLGQDMDATIALADTAGNRGPLRGGDGSSIGTWCFWIAVFCRRWRDVLGRRPAGRSHPVGAGEVCAADRA